MSNLIHWGSPLDDFQRMHDEINRFFWGRHLPALGPSREFPTYSAWGPAVDVTETQNEVIVRAEIPGVNPDDLDLTVTEDGLSIRGEVKQETNAHEQGFRRIERRYGSFFRSIPFPVAVQHEMATADYTNGILEVKVPKAEHARSKSTKLRINRKSDVQ